jgi:DNA (cytosine-5)-methyltransferase 1
MRMQKYNFIDVFAGCGGLSLGLFQAGWKGQFAVEKDSYAFSTLKYNLIDAKQDQTTYQWPTWLLKEASTLEAILDDQEGNLVKFRDQVLLLVGGPPCQGFSMLGKRRVTDPRNQAFKSYLRLVDLIRPEIVMIENVRGIASSFDMTSAPVRYSDIIKEALKDKGYNVWSSIVRASDYGVPQSRPRFIIVGFRASIPAEALPDPFVLLSALRPNFLKKKKLNVPVSVADALSDLLRNSSKPEQCVDSPRYDQGRYAQPKTPYQKLMHGSVNSTCADSHRFTRHKPETKVKFKWFLDNCEPGRIIEPEERGAYQNRKHTVYILHPDRPAPTVTTLPDDMLHYCEPRILTVREMARLQSFPDWFEFKGKYTTGGAQRTKECPRYTQVGNAVPPLLAEALGEMLLEFYDQAKAICKAVQII